MTYLAHARSTTSSATETAVQNATPSAPRFIPAAFKGREAYAYRNAIPLLFKGEERFRELTLTETSVLAALLRRARVEFGGRCWPTHEQLVHDLHGGLSKRHATRVVASLRNKGWIEVETAHAGQRLPNGRAVVGGECNVYKPNLPRIVGEAAAPSHEDGHDGAPRMDARAPRVVENARNRDASLARDPDLKKLNKHTDPQRRAEASPGSSKPTPMDDATRESAKAVLAYWHEVSFPPREGSGTLDFATGHDGERRLARIAAMLGRGFAVDVLKDAILGASLDDYVRGAGAPLGIIFGDKVLHYAQRGFGHCKARNGKARARHQERAFTDPPAGGEERISGARAAADLARLFRIPTPEAVNDEPPHSLDE